jgi:NAD(P)-dependent dehydrogenase (short-subunit alcohol dehydrogenase family)
MESLTPEIAPFGIRTVLVEPGFFRTESLTTEMRQFAAYQRQGWTDQSSVARHLEQQEPR